MVQSKTRPGKPIVLQGPTSSQKQLLKRQQQQKLPSVINNMTQLEQVSGQSFYKPQQQAQFNVMPEPQVTRAPELSMIENVRGFDYRDLLMNIGEVGNVLSHFPAPSNPPTNGPIGTNTIRIKHSELDTLDVAIFAKQFPCVANLDVLMVKAEAKKTIDFLIPHLLKWKDSLRSLRIWASFLDSKPEDEMKNEDYCHFLVHTFNKLPSLKKLTLDLNAHIGLLDQKQSPPEIPIDLPVLNKLIHFNISTHDPFHSFVQSLTKYCHHGLREVRIANPVNQNGIKELIPVGDWDLKMYLIESVKMIVTTNSCGPEFMFKEHPQLRDFCERFTSLTHLRICFSDTLAAQHWVPALASLPSLTNLYIEHVTKNTFSGGDIRFLFKYKMNALSVLTLQLNQLKSHDHLKSSLWNTLFPTLKYIHVYHDMSACDDCNYHSFRELTKEQQFVCINQVANPLRNCQSIVDIFLIHVLDNSSCEYFDGEVKSNAYEWFTNKLR